ncbi:formyl transferase, partial [Dipodascopsis tothii]|uniref:formyl transferase n=1 Tax=Dipodascopsis tothii TaxID=44089 RepID=UPI0034CF1566
MAGRTPQSARRAAAQAAAAFGHAAGGGQRRPAAVAAAAARRCLHTSASADRPLRIMYFGSDAFSIQTLQAVTSLQQTRPDVVADVQVAVRRPKPAGRGRRTVREVALQAFARGRGLRVHEVDSRADFEALAGAGADLAVAVSYGRLIPARYLSQLAFGGLNVHPSVLPQYSGPSPLQYAIADGVAATGVTVQTLDPHAFDRGRAVAVERGIAVAGDDTAASLAERVAVAGAGALARVLVVLAEADVDELDEAVLPTVPTSEAYSYAPKIARPFWTVDWAADTAAGLGRRFRACMRPLETAKTYAGGVQRTVLLDGVAPVAVPAALAGRPAGAYVAGAGA